MKYYRSITSVAKCCFLLLLASLYGCASHVSLEEHRTEWIARPLAELKEEMSNPGSYASKTGWKETTYPLANGNYVYIEPFSSDCSLHWETTSGGVIVGCKPVGSGCERELGPVSSTVNTITAPSTATW